MPCSRGARKRQAPDMLSSCASARPVAATNDKVCWSSRRPWQMRNDASNVFIVGYISQAELHLPARPRWGAPAYGSRFRVPPNHIEISITYEPLAKLLTVGRAGGSIHLFE